MRRMMEQMDGKEDHHHRRRRHRTDKHLKYYIRYSNLRDFRSIFYMGMFLKDDILACVET
jgi:hypothetical protein